MNETNASLPTPEPASFDTAQNEPKPVYVRMPTTPSTVTFVLIGVTVVMYLLQMLSVAIWGYAVYDIGWLEVYGARINESIRAGELWRFITPVFLHGSVAHIFFNMYALFNIGSFLERQLGHGRFVLLYFLSGFAGNVFSFLFTGEGSYSVGASTAVFGLIGAQAIFFYQNRELFGSQARQAIGNTVFIIAINLFIGMSPGIDNWGHIGGLLGGVLFALFASPLWKVVGMPPELSLQDEREARDILTASSAVAIVFGLLAGWGMFR